MRNKNFDFKNNRFRNFNNPNDINFPQNMSREEFEEMFAMRMNAMHRRENEFEEDFTDYTDKNKKENLKPLSIRVKPQTKEFYKDKSILTPREVLEIYEDFTNGSEAFINSLIEEEKNLEKELSDVREKLNNTKLFMEKLSKIEPKNNVSTDEDRILQLKKVYKNSEIKVIGNETSPKKAINSIIRDIQIYNTIMIRVFANEFLTINVYTNIQPIVYYFKKEYSNEDITEIIKYIQDFSNENDITFNFHEKSCFDE